MVTHPLWVQEVPGSIPGAVNCSYVIFCCCYVFTYCLKTHYLSHDFAILCVGRSVGRLVGPSVRLSVGRPNGFRSFSFSMGRQLTSAI